jgi:MFS transporter, putative metabolite:H+ symporter
MTVLASELSARLERLPLSRWHWRMLGILGLAWCFDGFDSTIIGAIAAALQKQWQIDPRTMGFLISSNLAGAVIGALLASLADRLGRKRLFQWSLIWFSLLSFACAFAWNMPSLIGFRFLMGFGLGAELPIMASYMGELVPANTRGWMQGLLNVFWPIGAILSAAVSLLLISSDGNGWRWAFVLGAVPALLVGFSRRLLPESPRWLALQGRDDEARRVVERIEEIVQSEISGPLPPVSRAVRVAPPEGVMKGLFGSGAGRRTIMLWGLLFFAYIGNAGLFGWMPTLFTNAGFSLNKSFAYVLIMQLAYMPNMVFGAYLMDKVGRKAVLAGNGLLSGATGLVYGYVLVHHASAEVILLLGVVVSFFVSAMFGAIQVYGPEQYSTSVRATGYGTARIFGNTGATLGPIIIGFVLPAFGTLGVFTVISASFVIASAFVLILGDETRGVELDAIAGEREIVSAGQA